MSDAAGENVPRILILAWGNPLRGDDAVGWRAAEQLSTALHGCRATVRVSHQLLPEYAAQMSGSDLVIFIDAACDNGVFGTVSFERVEPRNPGSAAFSHQLDPPALLHLAQSLYGSSPEAYFFTVRGRSFEYGEELSPEVEAAMPELLARIRSLCGRKPPADGDSRKAT